MPVWAHREAAHTRLVQRSKSVTLFHMTDLAQTPDRTHDALPLGPHSLVWRYFGDNRMYLIGPRPAVLQNMLAELGQGVFDHSTFFADTAERLRRTIDRKSTRLNSSHLGISYAVFCLKKK